VEVDQRKFEAEFGQGAARLLDRRDLDDLRPEAAQVRDKPPTKYRVILKQENLAP
jgi:hypothetical protein